MNVHQLSGTRGGFPALASLLAGIAVAFLFTGPATAADRTGNFESVGPGVSTSDDGVRTPPCDATLLMNGDDSWENGYAWRYMGVVPPDFGSFAEGYEGVGTVCGVRYHFSTLEHYYLDQTLDAYVHDSDGLNPRNVLCVVVGVAIDPPALWPVITVHDVGIPDTGVNGGFFVGYWGNWPGTYPGWFCAADLDGFGGMPRTKIAPDIGYPSGWQDPSVIWGPTQAMGCDAWFNEGPPPTAVTVRTWGAIKNLYR